MTIKYSVDDVLTLRSGAVWKVARIDTSGTAGRPYVALDDPANPGKHGTAFYVDVLDNLVVKHVPAGSDRAALIGNLTADLMASGWLWGIGPAETLARRLAALGWHR